MDNAQSNFLVMDVPLTIVSSCQPRAIVNKTTFFREFILLCFGVMLCIYRSNDEFIRARTVEIAQCC
jgi:hypothetical protein